MRLLAALLAASMPWTAGAVDTETLASKRPAKTLSAYGFFEDIAAQRPAAGVVGYELSTPLFSDHAEKLRFVYAPAPAAWSEDEVFDFPVGSALVKTFAYPADLRAPRDDLRLIETRVLIRGETGWAAWPYLWDEAAGDATLKLAGARLKIDVIGLDGAPMTIDYRVPNANQCKGCHARENAITPIGPKARYLNHPIEEETTPQLANWVDDGLLQGIENSPPSVDWREGDLDARARAYLDVNCAHCHRRDGPASNSGLFLTYGEADPVAWGLRKRPVAAGRGSGGLAFDIAPGRPEESIFVYRMKSLDPGVMMPELGRSLVHEEGVALIEAWIAAME